MKRIVLIIAGILSATAVNAADNEKPWSVRMVESEMARNPSATYIDGLQGKLKWNYTTGLELSAFLDVYDRYDDRRMWDYVVEYADTIINDKGEIYGYKKENFNIDHICPGNMLFRLYERTGEQKYRRTLRLLRGQITDQPRTSEGGFWHKQIYPWQMWLDGLYMGSPFYARYAKRFEKGEQRTQSFEDIANQFIVIAKHTYDPQSRLYRHAWDESREMFWADPQTGQSKHVWGRALGWYVMALVDALDYLPGQTKGRDEMISILQGIYKELPRYADPVTGMWYQVLELPGREGNYQEATASAMFVYGMLKAVRKGYLERSLLSQAEKNYHNFIETFVRENPDGTISLTKCCEVAGLGGKTNRSGTFEYYISEPVRDDDPKGVGPFIWASLEYEAMNNIDYDIYAGEERPVAFPGADGGGKYTSGGRGGRVIYVTKLTDDGSEGTLRHAVEQEGPRTVLFKVSGNISLEKPLRIENGDLTIAGQSAPGDGICIRDNEVFVAADNVIVRFLRFRLGDRTGLETDSFGGRWCNNVIIDHCSMSWSTDECASFYGNKNFTMQWCIVSEALNSSVHSKGNHGYGGIIGGRNASFHHNLFAHNNSRNPRFDHPAIYPEQYMLTHRGSVEFVNNLIYNWGGKAIYGGEEGWWNVVENVWKAGPATNKPDDNFIEIFVSPTTSMIPGRYYIADNASHDRPGDFTLYDNWVCVEFKGDATRESTDNKKPFSVRGEVKKDNNPQNAESYVLMYGGASKVRDAVDKRIVDEVNGTTYTYTGSHGGFKGIIDSQQDVGGWPELGSLPAPEDSDGDGMPDEWERRNGLDPADPADGNYYSLNEQFTNLEVYLHYMATPAMYGCR